MPEFPSHFDFSFTTFIALRFLKVIYAIAVGLVILFGAIMFFALASKGGMGALLALIIVPLGVLFYLMTIRVYMEIIAVANLTQASTFGRQMRLRFHD